MDSELNTGEKGNGGSASGWLAGLMLRRGGEFLPRFAFYYRDLARRPRRWRRQLRRKLAVTVTGAALLLALAGPMAPARAEADAPAANIQVVNGEVADANNGKCSLIEAIINARTERAGQLRPDCAAGNLSGPDTVVLPAGGEFVLTAAHNEVYGPTGLPVITSAVVIDGNGATVRRSNVYGTPEFRILAVDASGALTLRDTTISNGSAVESSYHNGYGGGIFSFGKLTLEGSVISDNFAYGYSSGGGGIYADGPITVTDSTITGNLVICGGGGGSGGGMQIGPHGQVTITESDIADNSIRGYWGGWGGGISIRGQALIVDSTIAGNVSGGGEGSLGGGGVFVSGQATITGSTIRDNLAAPSYEASAYDIHPGVGGGLSNVGTTIIANSTVSGNVANYGGGLANLLDGNLTVTSSTVSGNDAFQTPYDYEYGQEGGSGGGLFSGTHYYGDNCSTTTLRSVILSGNTADVSARQLFFGPSTSGYCTATIEVNAFNVFGQNGASGLSGLSKGATDIVPSVGLSATLSPLADNGGPTQTHALPPGSPALDLAPNASCTTAPVTGIDQRGQPRNQNGKDGVTANECDAGSFELQTGGGSAGAFLISPTGSGAVGGLAFAPADILKFDPAAGWSMYFDGSDVGVTKNLAAFELLDNGNILMSFAANQPIPGVGTFAPQDVARFVPTATGSNTAGTFQWELDGSAHWLTTTGEKIDALGDLGDGRLALSTAGAAAVKLPNGTTLKAQDEDALGFNRTTEAWSAFFNGTLIPGLGVEDVNALWIDPATGDLTISIVGAFNLGGVKGDGKDIVKLTVNPAAPGGYTPSLWWDGSAAGFPSNIDGLEILP